MKIELKLLDDTRQKSSTVFFLSIFHTFHNLDSQCEFLAKKLQSSFCDTVWLPHLLLSSYSYSKGQLMSPCPSFQHSCRCPPLLFHAGNEFPALHMMAGAESLPIATEKHYTGLQMLLLSVALKILAMPVPLRGHWRWLQSVLWGWCSFSWEKWSPNIRLSFQPCLSTGNHLWELMWVTCDLLIINFILLRHMELSSQLSVTRKTAQLSFNVKAYHSHVKSGRLPFLSAYLPITSKWHFCSQRELQTGGLHCS